MKLAQSTMKMPITKGISKTTTSKLVMLWKEVGLCVHKGLYVGKHEKITYHVSHFNSGLSVLRGIRSLEEAKKYMERLHNEVIEDWRFALQDWESEENKDVRHETKQTVDGMQKEIYQRG